MKSRLKYDKYGNEQVVIKMSRQEASELIDKLIDIIDDDKHGVVNELFDQLHNNLNLCAICNPDSNGYPDEGELDV